MSVFCRTEGMDEGRNSIRKKASLLLNLGALTLRAETTATVASYLACQ